MVLYYKCEGRIINLTNLNVDKIKIPVNVSTNPHFQIGAQTPNVSFQAGLKFKPLENDVFVNSTQKEVPELKDNYNKYQVDYIKASILGKELPSITSPEYRLADFDYVSLDKIIEFKNWQKTLEKKTNSR